MDAKIIRQKTYGELDTHSAKSVISQITCKLQREVNFSMERPGYHNLKQSKLTPPLKIQPDSKYCLTWCNMKYTASPTKYSVQKYLN